jgi:hypothetical protein
MTIQQRGAEQGERELGQTRQRRVARRGALLGWALALLSEIGCGSGDGDPGNAPSGGPLYVGSTILFSADLSDATGYLFSTQSLNAGTSVDPSRAVEMPETAWVFGDAKPYLYTVAIEQPRITRWEMTATGAFVQGPTVSFANEGVGGTYTAASRLSIRKPRRTSRTARAVRSWSGTRPT